MNKKIIALALATTSLISIFASAASYNDQDDITQDYAIERLSEYGIINGNLDGNFYPDNYVTRAEMAKMISVMLTKGEPEDKSAGFSDTVGHWAEDYIADCVSRGIVSGKSATSFAPDDKVTGEEAAKMLLVALGLNSSDCGLVGSDWINQVYTYASSTGIDYDISSFLFYDLTREDAALMICNTLDAYVPNSDGTYPTITKTLGSNLGYTYTKTSPRAIYEAIESNFRAMFGQTAMIESLYGLSDELEEAHLSITMMSPGMDEVFIAKVKSDKMSVVKSALEDRKNVLINEKAWYPSDVDSAQTTQIISEGDYIMLVVCSDTTAYETIEQTFIDMVK